jgi:hypothetical protein
MKFCSFCSCMAGLYVVGFVDRARSDIRANKLFRAPSIFHVSNQERYAYVFLSPTLILDTIICSLKSFQNNRSVSGPFFPPMCNDSESQVIFDTFDPSSHVAEAQVESLDMFSFETL